MGHNSNLVESISSTFHVTCPLETLGKPLNLKKNDPRGENHFHLQPVQLKYAQLYSSMSRASTNSSKVGRTELQTTILGVFVFFPDQIHLGNTFSTPCKGHFEKQGVSQSQEHNSSNWIAPSWLPSFWGNMPCQTRGAMRKDKLRSDFWEILR